ncbi:E3 ubiquitin-protein ligase PUB23-like [Andrographis paniculata]|uniref:E3 ubiquitin-protein ligase PUB23-like n=1 Tax=Andrographis paniculata TaxID=175694 RepID=UPI0021E6F77A|nr:E3 ubiquitin-protein ligase PUB23-like [Andrographis paniculata]
MAEIEVPPYFLCPISLEIMKDPVTISTGITYDRDSIEKWIFSEKNSTCPVTKQPLSDTEIVTPNITLRRLIQSWCTLHASHGIQRLPTPKAPVTKPQILKLLEDANSPHLQIKCLQRLRSIASQSQTNKRSMESAGAGEFLASLIVGKTRQASSPDAAGDLSDLKKACQEALAVLYTLQLSESSLQTLTINSKFIDSLTLIMQFGDLESRAQAIVVLKSALEVADPSQIINSSLEFFVELIKIMKDRICPTITKAALKVLINVGPLGRNRIKLVEAGAVPVLINLLLDSPDRRTCEMLLTALDFLCQCPDGRAEFLNHAAGLAVVSKKILRVSPLASEKALRILQAISRHSATPAVLLEMLQIGVVAKLCLVLQLDCGSKTKERAREILRSNARAWKNSHCVPNTRIFSDPNSN